MLLRALTAFAQLKLNSNATNGHSISWRTADSQRWNFNKSGAESGGNAGSNLSLFRYSDAGSYLGNPLTLNRATGNINIEGNIAPSAGKGIDFSANPNAGGMTSELFDDYEEGTWTPTYTSSGATFTYTEQYGSYAKIGRLVIAQFRLKVDTATGTTTNGVNVSNLPFSSADLSALSSNGVAMGLQNFAVGVVAGSTNNNSSSVTLWRQGTTTQIKASETVGYFLNGTIMYFTA